jgi:hypothetical protein
MKYISINNEKQTEYNYHRILGVEWIETDENGKATKYYSWRIEFPDDEQILYDRNSIDGGKLQSIENAINDAKKNIDCINRLKKASHDYANYKLDNYEEFRQKVNKMISFNNDLYRRVGGKNNQQQLL